MSNEEKFARENLGKEFQFGSGLLGSRIFEPNAMVIGYSFYGGLIVGSTLVNHDYFWSPDALHSEDTILVKTPLTRSCFYCGIEDLKPSL